MVARGTSGLEVAGRFGATLRDYARFGLFFMEGGVIEGARVLPEGWVREATVPREVGGKQVDYGYMWWPVPAADGLYADGALARAASPVNTSTSTR